MNGPPFQPLTLLFDFVRSKMSMEEKSSKFTHRLPIQPDTQNRFGCKIKLLQLKLEHHDSIFVLWALRGVVNNLIMLKTNFTVVTMSKLATLSKFLKFNGG